MTTDDRLPCHLSDLDNMDTKITHLACDGVRILIAGDQMREAEYWQ